MGRIRVSGLPLQWWVMLLPHHTSMHLGIIDPCGPSHHKRTDTILYYYYYYCYNSSCLLSSLPPSPPVCFLPHFLSCCSSSSTHHPLLGLFLPILCCIGNLVGPLMGNLLAFPYFSPQTRAYICGFLSFSCNGILMLGEIFPLSKHALESLQIDPSMCISLVARCYKKRKPAV